MSGGLNFLRVPSCNCPLFTHKDSLSQCFSLSSWPETLQLSLFFKVRPVHMLFSAGHLGKSRRMPLIHNWFVMYLIGLGNEIRTKEC